MIAIFKLSVILILLGFSSGSIKSENVCRDTTHIRSQFKEDIKNGQIDVGMNEREVIASIGKPLGRSLADEGTYIWHYLFKCDYTFIEHNLKVGFCRGIVIFIN